MKKINHNTPSVLSLDALSKVSNQRLNTPVTIFRGTHAHPQRHITLHELFSEIQTSDAAKLSHSQSIVCAYEQYLIQAAEQVPQAKAAYNELKNQLNGFLMGNFTYRANDVVNCAEYVPCLVFDLDSCISNYQAFELQQKIQALDYVFSVFPSPSGHGLRVLVWTASTYETHRIVYQQILVALCADLNLTTDRKRGIHFDATCENESRHFYYVAVKPQDFYLNLESTIWEQNQPKIVPKETVKDDLIPKTTHSIVKQDIYTYIDEINDDVKIDFIIKRIDMNKPRKLQCFDFGCRCCENQVPFEAAKRSALEHFWDSEQKNPEKIIETQLKDGYDQTMTRYTDEQFAAYLLKTHQIKVVNAVKKHLAQDFSKKEVKTNPTQDRKSIFTMIETKLKQHYDFRRNIISQEIELRIKPNGGFETMDDSEFNNLIRFLSDEGLNISHKKLETSLFSDFTPKYDPIQLYFEALPEWNHQIDYIKELSSYVIAKNQEWFELMFRKMLVRAIACSLGITENKHCFVLFGGQHNGKTHFLRYLCPPALKNYRKENFKTDKDGILALGQNFLIILDELDRLKKEDSESLKAVFSMDVTKERLPFGKMPMKFKRIANFVGTTNKKEILSDETGNIRWLIMEIMAIRHDDGGPNGYSKINIDNVWSQAYFLLKEGYPYKLTKENFVDSEANNELFRHVSVEKELLVQYFLLPQQNNKEKVKLMTSTNILMTLQKLSTFNNLKLSNLRKALRELGYEEKQIFQIGKVFMVIENFKTK
jgi:predicted P-loop ATPase